MAELIPKHLIDQIFKLDLDARLIADNKVALPILIKSKAGEDTYRVLLDVGKSEMAAYKKVFLELKGRVDIEYLKYGCEVSLTPIQGTSSYYKMHVLNIYKMNNRRYRRVPYRRAIKIVDPILCDGVLVNLSASGAMIQSDSKIQGDSLTMEFTLLKKNMSLEADIIEQKYNEKLGVYEIRCEFEELDKKSKKILLQAVKEITLRAKRRLQEQA